MSIRVMSWVWDNSSASGSELLLLLAIADFADDEGNAFPSVDTLAAKTRISRSSVFRAQKRCVAAGWLEISERGTGRSTTHYRIIMDTPSGVSVTPQGSQDDTTRSRNLTPQGCQIDTPGVSDRPPRGVTRDHPGVSLLTHRTVIEPSLNSSRSAHAPNPPTPTRRARPQGTRLPSDFRVTAEMRAWFDANIGDQVNGKRETEKFRNYWTAKTGQAATKLDWPATWRNWMLKAAEQ